jgi:hypothetical protein
MESEKTPYLKRKEEIKNLLLEGPELVLPKEENKQEGIMSFSFSSDTRRYCLGLNNDEPFLVIEYFDSLPDELSKAEKEKFTKKTRKEGKTEKVVYVLRYGKIPEPREKIEKPDQNKKYYIAKPRNFEGCMINNKEIKIPQLVEI